MSWKNEVLADNSGTWSTNALRFATKQEAEEYGSDLYSRWTLVRKYRAVECTDPVNYRWDPERGKAVSIEVAA